MIKGIIFGQLCKEVTRIFSSLCESEIVLKTMVSSDDGSIIRDVLPEDFNNAYVCSNHRIQDLASNLDPFLRQRFKNSRVKDFLYKPDDHFITNSYSNDGVMILKNLCLLPINVVCYFSHFFVEPKDFFKFLSEDFTCKKNSKNPRVAMGISKNQEMLFRYIPYKFILDFPHYVFDDDVEFLYLAISNMKNSTKATLLNILEIKQIAPYYSYEQILRQACINRISFPNESLTWHIENLNTMAQAYNEMGFKKRFRLLEAIPVNDQYFKHESAEDISIDFEYSNIYPIMNSHQLDYANALSGSMCHDDIKSALMHNSRLYLIEKDGKYLIAECRESIVMYLHSKDKSYF